jgi:hypothetical protein
MNRDRSYYRKMRAKAIKRKKTLTLDLFFNPKFYHDDGMYSKNKIHCSCGYCIAKTRNKSRRHIHGNYNPSLNYKHSDLVKLGHMNDSLKDFYLEPTLAISY